MGDDGCCGGHCCGETGNEDGFTIEELAESNYLTVTALAELLVRKGVITQDELEKVIDELAEEGGDVPDEQEGLSEKKQ